MNKEQFAELLNGRQYREEITESEEQLAKENDLIIVFGYSDDNIEFRGLIYDEIPAYDGAEMFIATPGTEIIVDEDEETYQKAKSLTAVRLNQRRVNEKNFVEAIWSPDELDCSWLIRADIPHATFDIMEDGELFCRGIVLSKSDIK